MSTADESEILQRFAQGVILGSLLAAAVESTDEEEDIDTDDSDEGGDPLLALLVLRQLMDGGQQSRPSPSSDSPPHRLLAACLRGDLVEVRRLASHPSVSIEASPAFLHAAIKRGHVEVVEFLLKEGADKSTPLNEKCPLHLAFVSNQFEIFKLLLNSGADLSRLHEELPQVLHMAAADGRLNFIELLLREGGDVNAVDSNNETPLHNVRGNLEIAQFLVQNGADVNFQSDLGLSPLHAASNGRDNPAVVDLLIRSGADVDCRLKIGTTPLHVASRAGNLSIMKSLVGTGAAINAVDGRKHTPLHYAVLRDPSLEAIQFLLENGADVWAEEVDGQTAFDMAARRGINEDVVKSLLSSSTPPKKLISSAVLCSIMKNYSEEILSAAIAAGAAIDEPVNETGATALHYAAVADSMTFVEILVAAGSNVDALDANEETPVELALHCGHFEIAEFLLERSMLKGQRSELLDNACMISLIERRYSLARLLIRRGANPNYRGRETGLSFLQISVVKEDRLEALKLLLEEGADPEDLGGFLVTPLALASALSDLPKVQALVAAGAKVNSKGTTPFLMACQMGQLPLLNFLYDSGAKVFNTLKNKTSALHIASMFGRLEAMKFLLTKGFDINSPTELPERWTPLHFAAGANWKETMKKLEVTANEDLKEDLVRSFNQRDNFFPHGCPPAARLLVEEGADVNAIDGKGRSALHFFCSHGDLPTATFLVQNGAKVDDASFTRGSPLHSACEGGHFPVVKFLLAQGADLKAKNTRGDYPAATAALGSHWSLLPLLGIDDPLTVPLQMAASRGDLPAEVLPELVDSLGVLGYSALHFGALNGHLSVVRRLLHLGANATLKGTNEHVIHSAIRGKNVDVLREVMAAIWASCEENGGHLHVEMNRREDSVGETPLMTAVRSGKLEMVELLVDEETVDRNLQNENGLTALHIAAEKNLIHIAELLAAKGIDETLRDSLGRSAYDIAVQNDNREILEFLSQTPPLHPTLTSEDDLGVEEGGGAKNPGRKALLEKEDGSQLPPEVETQGTPQTQFTVNQQPLTSGAHKETSEVSSPSGEIAEDSNEKKEKSASCFSAIFCCCCSSN